MTGVKMYVEPREVEVSIAMGTGAAGGGWRKTKERAGGTVTVASRDSVGRGKEGRKTAGTAVGGPAG